MPQQIIALALIIFFLIKLFRQRKKNIISINEFRFWLGFWSISAIAIVFIKELDKLLKALGFSASGINFLAYTSILILFYLVFRLRLKIVKIEKDITKIIRDEALNK